MRRWSVHGEAEFDTRVGRLELWAVNRGWYRLANLLARLRAGLKR